MSETARATADHQNGQPGKNGAQKRPEGGDRRAARERQPKHDGDKRRDRRPERPADRRPPRFNVDELQAVAGAPVWQSTHDAVVVSVDGDHVRVRTTGVNAIEANVPRAELPEVVADARVRVRLLDPPAAGAVAQASARQAVLLDGLTTIEKAVADKAPVQGYVVNEVKGGFSVALLADNEDAVAHGVRAFLPSSQATAGRFVGRFERIVGEVSAFDVAEFEAVRANVVVTRKARLLAERKATLAEKLANLKEGDVVSATVKTLMPYGAFLEVHGLDAMVHQSDLTWDGRTRVSDVLKPGQVLDVKVLHKNPDNNKLKVGVKQLAADPWAEVRAAFAEGTLVKGVVVALADFGAFVKLPLPSGKDHVEGLIHVSEISWNKLKHPSAKLSIGQEVEVKVLGLDTDAHRISLSLKALEKNPFETVAGKFPVGTVVKAKIKSLAEFGAFVELAEGVDGLVHVGELSWTEHPRHPSEIVNIGQEIEAVVVNIDLAKQRVGLSIKKAQPNPFDAWESKYQKGARLKMKVVRVDERGAHLEVEAGLSCFCPSRDLVGKEGDGRVERAQEAVKQGETIEVQVIAFDRRFKKVSVSARAIVEGDTQAAYDDYKKQEAAGAQMLNPLADKLKALRGGDA